MKRSNKSWTIEDLRERYHTIWYPEFQREPTVWRLKMKQLLIDSILRGFDIGSIYLVEDAENLFQCVDGRQRLNAIFAFMGLSHNDRDNDFTFKPTNEVESVDDPLSKADGVTYNDSRFDAWRDGFDKYELRIVLLSGISEESELNLQFQRLQVAQILVAAEKLNAMLGEMRDHIFGSKQRDIVGLGTKNYFQALGTRSFRFGPEQTASQIVLNAVSYRESGQFHRARFADMQEFFKKYYRLNDMASEVLRSLKEDFDKICELVPQDVLKRIKNRALAVSIALFYHIEVQSGDFRNEDWKQYGRLIDTVINELERVSKKAIEDEPTDWESLQLAITQASVERYAIERRHSILKEKFRELLEGQ